MPIDCELIGWADEGPTLRLDHREFSYAGKFVMSSTGKAVARESPEVARESPEDDTDSEGEVVAAVAFNEDRTDPGTLWLRYVTVRADRRGEGIGPRLVEFVVSRARGRGYERARIAVNNPYAYHALYRAGFRYTGRETGIAELVLERDLGDGTSTDPGRSAGDPGRCEEGPDPDRYEAGLVAFLDRDLGEAQRSFVAEKREAGPPDRRPGGADRR